MILKKKQKTHSFKNINYLYKTVKNYLKTNKYSLRNIYLFYKVVLFPI